MCQTHSRRQFVRRAGAAVSALGALQVAGAAALPAPVAAAPAPVKAPVAPVRVFDAHLHCPAESGELWQWHTVTRNFEEFVAYLDKTGVERGIINSQRSPGEGHARRVRGRQPRGGALRREVRRAASSGRASSTRSTSTRR